MNVAFIIFGITGDLSKKKLIPALFSLYEQSYLSKDFSLVGFGRKALEKEDFSSLISKSLKNKASIEDINNFIQKCSYVDGAYDHLPSYEVLKNKIEGKQSYFYLSVPPLVYSDVISALGQSKLIYKSEEQKAVILIEKPFGEDLDHTKTLNLQLTQYVLNQQVYRVDHYLAKKALIDFIELQKSDFLQKIFSQKKIKKITCNFFETLTVEDRAGFYDPTGALEDVGQNHILQMLAVALIKKDDVGDIQEKRQRIFGEILSKSSIITTYRGQYEGYTKEQGVKPASDTETFFRIEMNLQHENNLIEVILQGGKAMNESSVVVEIEYEAESHEKIKIDMTHSKIMLKDFVVNLDITVQPEGFQTSEAYEKIIFESLKKNKDFFVSGTEAEIAWQFTNKINEVLIKNPLIVYKKGATIEKIIEKRV